MNGKRYAKGATCAFCWSCGCSRTPLDYEPRTDEERSDSYTALEPGREISIIIVVHEVSRGRPRVVGLDPSPRDRCGGTRKRRSGARGRMDRRCRRDRRVAHATCRREARALVDAPLLVLNQPRTQRLCENQVGKCYGRWKVSANSTNLGTRHLAGVALRRELEARGWSYDDGLGDGLSECSRLVSECYPHTTLVGAREFGYDHERPLYKRKPRRLPAAEWRPMRAAACDELVRRIDALSGACPALDLRSNLVTAEPSQAVPARGRGLQAPGGSVIDALLAAWTAALWHDHGLARSQVLGADDPLVDARGARATIIAPARQEQRSAEPTR